MENMVYEFEEWFEEWVENKRDELMDEWLEEKYSAFLEEGMTTEEADMKIADFHQALR